MKKGKNEEVQMEEDVLERKLINRSNISEESTSKTLE
jgi:hypothetical protein